MPIKSKSKKAKSSKEELELKKKKKKSSKSKKGTDSKKVSKKKTATKKPAAKAKAPAKRGKPKKSTLIPIKEKFTKTSLLDHLASESGLEKKDVRKVMNAFEETVASSIVKRGLGEFTWPTMLKVVTKVKPATKEREGINPFTQEPCIFKAKPKTTQVKVRPLGKLKKAAKGEL